MLIQIKKTVSYNRESNFKQNSPSYDFVLQKQQKNFPGRIFS